MTNLYVVALLLLFFNKEFTQSLRCAQQCAFTGVPLDYVLPPNRCATVDKPREEQHCNVQLTIDFVSRLVNGSLDAQPQLLLGALTVQTTFSLDNPSVVAFIKYDCSTTDYCDQEFVRETLGPALANIQVSTLRQNLTDRLYNPSNTNTIRCSSKDTCATDAYCMSSYLHLMMIDPIFIEKFCSNSTNSPNVRWMQQYLPTGNTGKTEIGFFDCNKMPCDDNATVLQLVNMIQERYILPMNISVVNATLPPPISTTPKSSAQAFCMNAMGRFFVGLLASLLLLTH